MKNRSKELLINHTPYETRVALIEGGRLVEFYIERAGDEGLTGNIYKGKIVRVLPGMQAAFAEVGLDRTAFLHVGDVQRQMPRSDEVDLGDEEQPAPAPSSYGERRIQDILKSGQEIMVRVEKEPLGSKGARITSHISLPGRHLVLMPGFKHVGVSRRIESLKERRRLRGIIENLKPDNCGFIVRTACEEKSEEEIKADMDFLLKLWGDIQERYEHASTSGLIYKELDLSLRTVRDLFSQEVDRLLIDSEEEYRRVVSFIDKFLPSLRDRVERYNGTEPLFDLYGVEVELADAIERKVWLKSGGFLVMDQMEALTAIDVNTGRYVGRRSSEETILKTNLEAVKEIVYQLRLRNIGGIIVIDFIDMEVPSNREKVYNALQNAITGDKARTNILKISELGIVEMTRKRVRAGISQLLCEPCPYGEGNGMVKGKEAVIMEIYRELLREVPLKKRRKVTVYVNPAIADRISSNGAILTDLETRLKKKIVVRTVDLFHQEQYEIA
ncbi:MAG: ribonuclease E/G [Thermodesulfobacteriota bacterium]